MTGKVTTKNHDLEKSFEVEQEHSDSEVISPSSAPKKDLNLKKHISSITEWIKVFNLMVGTPRNILAILLDEYQHHAKKPYEDHKLEDILPPEFIERLINCEPITLCLCHDLKYIADKALANHISEMLHDTKSANGETKTIKTYFPIGFASLLEYQPCTKDARNNFLDNSGKSGHTGTKEVFPELRGVGGIKYRLRRMKFSPNEGDRTGNEACTDVDEDSGMKKTKNIAGEFPQTSPAKTKAGEAPPSAGELMHEVIKEHELSVYEVAKRIGVNRVLLHNVIKDERSLNVEIASKFAAHFSEYTEDELLWTHMKHAQYQYHHREEQKALDNTPTEDFTPVS